MVHCVLEIVNWDVCVATQCCERAITPSGGKSVDNLTTALISNLRLSPSLWGSMLFTLGVVFPGLNVCIACGSLMLVLVVEAMVDNENEEESTYHLGSTIRR